MQKIRALYNKSNEEISRLKNEIEALTRNLKKEMYTLFSVIIHDGTIDFGHYYCYVRKGKEWFLCNDENIRGGISSDAVLNHAAGDGCSHSNAYMLFYANNTFFDVNDSANRVKSYKYIEPVNIREQGKKTPQSHMSKGVGYGVGGGVSDFSKTVQNNTNQGNRFNFQNTNSGVKRGDNDSGFGGGSYANDVSIFVG